MQDVQNMAVLQQQMMFEAMQSPLGPEPDTIPMLPPPPPLISIHN